MTSLVTRRSTVAYLSAITSLLGLCNGTSAFAHPAGREVERLVAKIDELSGALRGALISEADWRSGVDDLLSRVPETDLMHAIDFDRLASEAGFADLGVSTARVRFDDVQDRTLSFLPKLFAVNTGRSIIPHGHANMVSAHLPLAGAFRLRQYDQVSRDAQALVVRPTGDRRIVAGDLSSIGEDDDNVHWFIAEEPSYTFDVIVTGLDDEAAHSFEIFNLDMEAAEARADGTLRVPRMSVADALSKYG